MKNSGRIHIGTSGWNYDHWKGPFYPENLSVREWLNYYVQQFRTVEINNSFYQLPAKKTFEQWREGTPEGFIFSVKASRYITHMKKLREPEKSLADFIERARFLKNKAGPVLFQLPPRWHANPERLSEFLNALPEDFRYTFEFRDSTWWNDETYETLEKHGAAFCIFELAGQHSPREVTADFIYIRLHGPGAAYQGQYSTETLAGWAGAFSAWQDKGIEIFCYFDNDQNGYAAQDARRLQEMIAD